jgi:cytoskeletal protein RodZ
VKLMPEIGTTLREARMRSRIDVSEIEAQTKIRAKYLRALENEEWDLLPGPTFVKSFLRTYGNALGLDGRALVEEYKLHYEHPGDGIEPIQQQTVSAPRRARQRAGGAMRRGTGAPPPRTSPSRAYMAAVGIVGIVIVLLVYALLSGGSSPSNKTSATIPVTSARGTHPKRVHRAHPTGTANATATLASLKVEPSAEVYVCLIGDGGRKRIPGVILTPESPEPVYHARRFELTLGNNDVALIVNGKPVTVPASSGAIGYAITRTGMRSLVESEAPTCK